MSTAAAKPSTTTRNLAFAFLILAVLVSLYILAVDNILWQYQPSHAYGLIAFIIVDLVLVGAVVVKPKVGFAAALIWGVLQILVLIGDAAMGLGVPETSAGVAAAYLFLGEGGGLKNPSGFAVDALLILYLALAVTGAQGRRAAAKA